MLFLTYEYKTLTSSLVKGYTGRRGDIDEEARSFREVSRHAGRKIRCP